VTPAPKPASKKKEGIERMKQRKLSTKLLACFIIFAACVTLFTGIALGVQYRRVKMQDYNDQVFAYAKTAAELIDGDRVLTYLETEQPDDYYESVLSLLSATREQSELLYYYVFVPYEDDLVYVWDGGTGDEISSLGDHETYMEGGKEAVEAIFCADPPEQISTYHDDTYGYIASGFYPIFNSAGEPVACVGVDISMDDVEQALYSFILIMVACVLGVSLVSIFVLYRVVDRGIAQPIRKLNTATRDLVNNLDQKKDFVVDISTGDEIEALADSFCRMDIEIKDYLTQLSAITAEKERIGAELDVARHIQSSMLPCIFPPFPDRKEFDIYATMTPAKEVGGDFYDFFMVDSHHLAVVMADVSGKGVPAALFMVIAKTLIKDHTTSDADLGAVFTTVNELLCESNSEGLFVTAFEGVLDLVTGEFRFVNAGHEMPYVYKVGGQYELRKLRPGFVLAGMEGMRYRSGSFMMEPGDKFFQYTDGVTEATDAGNNLYGQARLTESLNRHANDGPMELLPAIKADIDRFVGAAPQFDDITMLSLVYKERMEASE
jgi:sigma-B regulation protein RsbU (phosphoserine phosphatase)